MRRLVAMLACALLVIGCAAQPVAEPPPAPLPLPPIEQPEPEFDPDPVELAADIGVSEQGVLVLGSTNLPDGAVLVYDLLLAGSGCLTDDCSEFEVLTPEQNALKSGDSSKGYVTVSGGKFSVELPDWNTLPICGWDSAGEWETSLSIAFYSDERFAELSPTNPGQPESVYELYGRAAERVEAAPGVELGSGLSGPFVRIEVLC